MDRKKLFSNILNLVFGSGLAQFLPLVVSPLLTRMYLPEHFGGFTFFYSLMTLLGIISSGLFEYAILKPKKVGEAFNILLITNLLSICFSCFLAFFLLIFGEMLLTLMPEAFDWKILMMLPFGILFYVQFQSVTYWLTRLNKFRLISMIKISQGVILSVGSVLLGYFSFNSYGLIISVVVSYLLGTYYLGYFMHRFRNEIDFKGSISLMKKYIEYPKYIMPSSLINTFASQSPVYFIGNYFGDAILGFYSFANRILVAPVGIISSSIGQVFFKDLSNQINFSPSTIPSFFQRMVLILSGLSLIIFVPIIIWGETLFSFFFGMEWGQSGQFSKILSVALLTRFIVSPLSTTLIAYSKSKILSIWQMSYFFTSLIAIFILKDFSFTFFLVGLVCNDVLMYFIYFLFIRSAIIQNKVS